MWSQSIQQQQQKQQQQQHQQQQGNLATAEVSAYNKKKKELDECKCASLQVNAANSGCLACDTCNQKQISKLKNNSKANELHLDGTGKVTVEVEEEEEAVDSGFISGPNASSSSLAIENKSENSALLHQSNIKVSQQPAQHKGNSKQQESTFLDSGCIEAEEDFEDDIVNDIGIDDSAGAVVKNVDASVSDVAKIDVAVGKRQSEGQVQNELHNVQIGAATKIRTLSDNNNTNKTIADEMRFKNNVDSGITERFCSLSLQSGDNGINNLNQSTTQRRSSTVPIIHEGQQQQQQYQPKQQQQQQQLQQRQQSLPAVQQPRQKFNLNDWEEFYQQNSDGDT